MKEVTDRYKLQSEHYLDNAYNYIRKGDAAKSGEFLWGGLAEAIKAVAASKNRWINSHDEMRDYAFELARTFHDEGIWYAFGIAQSLHTNYYESGLKLKDVTLAADNIRRIVGKLLSLIPEEKAI